MLITLIGTLYLLRVNAGFVNSYNNCAIITDDHNAKLYWNIVGDTIEIGVEANASSGWFATGISLDGSMDSGGTPDFSDVWAMGYNTDESTCQNGMCVFDLANTRHSQPKYDSQQDVLDITVSTNASMLYAEFTRKLDTNDTDGDHPINITALTTMIWAINPTNKIKKGGLVKHTDKASYAVNFGKPSSCAQTPAPPGGGNMVSAAGGAWVASWTIDGEFIDFTVVCQTNGWVGLGISNDRIMIGADVVVGWVVDATNELVIHDSWTTERDQPNEDADQTPPGTNQIISSTGTQVNGVTTIQFRRKLISTDTNYDVNIEDKQQYILYAFDTADGDGKTFRKHKLNGAKPINFLNGNSTGNGTAPPAPVEGGIDPVGTQYTSPDGKFKVTWQIVNDTIHFKIECKTTGWCAMGINNDNPQMIGSDIFYGWVGDSDQSVIITDAKASVQAQPDLDTDKKGTNDILLTNGSQVDGVTTIIFRRKLVTNDTQDTEIKNADQYLVYSYGDAGTDGTDGLQSSIPKHIKTGTAQINFITGTAKSTGNLTPGLIVVVVMMCLLFAFGVYRLAYFIITFSYKKTNRSTDYWSSGSAKSDEGSNENSVEMTASGSSSNGLIKSVKEKSAGNKFTNFMYGVMKYRMPKTEIPFYAVLLAIIYVIFNIACLFVYKTDYAKAFGTLIAANAFLATLPAQRNSVIVVFTGMPFDKAIMFHRWLGKWTLILITIHFIMTLVKWHDQGLSLGGQIGTRPYLWGFLGWLVVISMFLTALPIFRRKVFELFYYYHFIFILFFVFGSIHNDKFIPYAIAALVFYVVDRIFRFLWGGIYSRTVSIKVVKDQVVQIRWHKSALARCFGRYQPGQYVFVNFLGCRPLEWHPFSVSSGPDEVTGECTIRGLGGFTKALIKKAKDSQHLLMRVDGPYGTLNMNYRRFPVVFLVSGGIGITPVMSILKDIYRTGNLDQKAIDNPPLSAIQHVYAVWVVQSMDQYQWFAEEFDAIRKAANGPVKPRLHLSIYVTRSSAEDAIADPFVKGRPKFETVFDTIQSSHPKKATSVFVCGPGVMVENVWDISNARSRAGHSFHFHNETFEL